MIEESDDYLHSFTYLINSEVPQSTFLGKHIFFSDDKAALKGLGALLLKELKLHAAKVPLSDTPAVADPGFGYVLCLYGPNDHADECKKYASGSIIYRGWRSLDDRVIDPEVHKLPPQGAIKSKRR